MKLLRDRLRAALERDSALSQAGLHRATGASTASVSNWFTGKSASMKAENLRTAAAYLKCGQFWLETGRGDPGWTSAPHPNGGLDIHSVAHDLSQRQAQHASASVTQVPVIGTLTAGADNMFQLKASPEGPPIGTVPTAFADSKSHALQVFGDELYPAVRHGTCLVVDPTALCVAGELVLIETVEGYFLVCELVSDLPEAIVWNSAIGGLRRTTARSEVQAMHAIVGLVPGSQLRRQSPP